MILLLPFLHKNKLKLLIYIFLIIGILNKIHCNDINQDEEVNDDEDQLNQSDNNNEDDQNSSGFNDEESSNEQPQQPHQNDHLQETTTIVQKQRQSLAPKDQDEHNMDANENQQDDQDYNQNNDESADENLDENQNLDDENEDDQSNNDDQKQNVIGINSQSTLPSVTYSPSARARLFAIIMKPGILAGIIGRAIIGVLTAILLIMFIVYRMRKKDEGSYALEETKKPLNAYDYRHCPTKEFYA